MRDRRTTTSLWYSSNARGVHFTVRRSSLSLSIRHIGSHQRRTVWSVCLCIPHRRTSCTMDSNVTHRAAARGPARLGLRNSSFRLSSASHRRHTVAQANRDRSPWSHQQQTKCCLYNANATVVRPVDGLSVPYAGIELSYHQCDLQISIMRVPHESTAAATCDKVASRAEFRSDVDLQPQIPAHGAGLHQSLLSPLLLLWVI